MRKKKKKEEEEEEEEEESVGESEWVADLLPAPDPTHSDHE